MNLLKWFASLTQIVFALGYPGVLAALVIEGLGLPFPGDAVMAFYGFAAAKGQFHLAGILIISTLGYVIGSVLSYWIGRKFAAGWLGRLSGMSFISRNQIHRTMSMIDRHGPWILVVGRFLPGVRAMSSYVAGFTKMDFQTFVVYTGIGAAAWCTLWVLIGFWFGESLRVIAHHVQVSITIGMLAGSLVLASVWFIRRRWAR